MNRSAPLSIEAIPVTTDLFDQATIDAVTELVTLGANRAAASLTELIGQSIELSVSTIRVAQFNDSSTNLLSSCEGSETLVTQTFDGPLRGRAAIGFSEADSMELAEILSGCVHGSVAELDSELSDILREVGNILLNSILGSFSNALSTGLRSSIPEVQTVGPQGSQATRSAAIGDDIVTADVRFQISDHEIRGAIFVVVAGGGLGTVVRDSLLSTAP